MCENSARRGVSVFALKLLALACMVTDHTAYVLFLEGWSQINLYVLLRSIGRLAFPIYCFLLVNGFEKSRDRGRYLLRLASFALLSQLPFTLAFTAENHRENLALLPLSLRLNGALPLFILALAAGLCWFFRRRGKKRFREALCLALGIFLPALELRIGGIYLLGSSLNVFYTLAAGLALLWLTEALIQRNLRPLSAATAFAVLLAYLALVQPHADYGLSGVALIFLLYLSRRVPMAQAAVICGWSVWQYLLQGAILPLCLAACLAAAAPLCYKGVQGRSMKRFFYLAYPLHLLVLGAVSILI